MRRSPVRTWFSALPGTQPLAPGVIGDTPGFEPGNSRFEPWGANLILGQQLKCRVALSKSEGCGFKSYLACLRYPRSSMDEQPPSKQLDAGSNPAGGAVWRTWLNGRAPGCGPGDCGFETLRSPSSSNIAAALPGEYPPAVFLPC
jgi:hypothetical protein